MPRKDSNSKPDKKQRTTKPRAGESKTRSNSNDKKPFERKPRSFDGGGEKKPYERKPRSFNGDDKKPYERAPRSFDGGEKKTSERKTTGGGYGDKTERKPYERKSPGFGASSDRKPYERKPGGYGSEKKGGYGDDKKPYERKPRADFGSDDKKPYERKPRSFDSDDKKPYERKPRSFDGNDKKPYERKPRPDFGNSDNGDRKPYERKPRADFGGSSERKPYERKPRSFDGDDKKPYERKPRVDGSGDDKKPYKSRAGYGGDKRSFDKKGFKTPFVKPGSSAFNAQKAYERKAALEKNTTKDGEERVADGKVRLNRYIANAGICSRREADVLIESGAVSVNGKVVTEMGYRVGPEDIINYGGERLSREKPVYMLINKPKDYITTTDDPKERKIVMSLVKHTGPERLYPVGRLDRNTTGLLLITNDGEMAKKLTHPSSRIKKIYHVYLDKNFKVSDFHLLAEGVELEDGFIKPDVIEYVSGAEDKKEIGVEMHSGRNRIVRRMFEHLGYTVVKLDRVTFAGLTKKNLPRGRSRYLTEDEINSLKML